MLRSVLCAAVFISALLAPAAGTADEATFDPPAVQGALRFELPFSGVRFEGSELDSFTMLGAGASGALRFQDLGAVEIGLRGNMFLWSDELALWLKGGVEPVLFDGRSSRGGWTLRAVLLGGYQHLGSRFDDPDFDETLKKTRHGLGVDAGLELASQWRDSAGFSVRLLSGMTYPVWSTEECSGDDCLESEDTAGGGGEMLFDIAISMGVTF